MAFANKFVASFSLAASALFGASAVLLYDQFCVPSASVQRPLTHHAAPAPAQKPRRTDGAAEGLSTHSPAQSVPDMPVVLPPSVGRSARAAVTETFHQACVDAARLGLPSTSEVRCYGGYIASLNYERRLPNWVLERLSAPSSSASPPVGGGDSDEGGGGSGVSRSRSKFFADATVPAPFRAAADEYTTRGLSRGHLAAARFHKHSQEELDSTFNMNANMVPQDMTVNAVDWERLESLTSRLNREVAQGGVAKKKKTASAAAHGPQGRLYVVSGPAFVPQVAHTVERWANGTVVQALEASSSPLSARSEHRVVQYELTGKNNLVAVPTHLFKVLLAEKRPSGGGGGGRPVYEAAAFLMPNRAIAEEKPLTDYQVPLAALEWVTGLTFFPGLGVPAQSLPNLCASHQCGSRPAALFATYRDVAQLRVAASVPELRQTYAQLQARNREKGGAGALDTMVEKEFHSRTAELVADSVRGVEKGG